MQIEIRFNNSEMKALKRLFYWNKRFKKWYLRHWRNVFGSQWVDELGNKHRPKIAPDVFIWLNKNG